MRQALTTGFTVVLLATVLMLSLASVTSTAGEGDDGSSRTTLKIQNKYAESIFNATYSVDGEEEKQWLGDKRLEMFETDTLQIEHASDALVTFVFNVTSVGETHEFRFEDIELTKGFGTLDFTYEYDSATLEFRLDYDY
jgi:hypothetical protein